MNDIKESSSSLKVVGEADTTNITTREELLRLARIEFARQGGRASMAKRTAQERQDMAKKGAKARWGDRPESKND